MLDNQKKGTGLGLAARRRIEDGLDNTWTQPPAPPTQTTPAGTGGNLPPLVQPVQGTGGNLPPNQTKPPQGTGGNMQPSVTNPLGTGGNLPPEVTRPPMGTGGNLPPTQVPTQGTGGNLPPTQRPTQGTGGNLPPVLDPVTGQPAAGQQAALRGGFSPVNVVTDTLGQIIDPNGAYMRNAQRRGLEQAATGGNRAGGSIAAGASQRAMMEAAQPLVNNALQLQGQREGYAFQGEQNQLERNRDYTQAQLQNWMDDNKFNREFYGALSMMPIQSAYQLNGLIQTYALENPDVYTADVISGMTNFFNQNFSQILASLMPSVYGGSGNGQGG